METDGAADFLKGVAVNAQRIVDGSLRSSLSEAVERSQADLGREGVAFSVGFWTPIPRTSRRQLHPLGIRASLGTAGMELRRDSQATQRR